MKLKHLLLVFLSFLLISAQAQRSGDLLMTNNTSVKTNATGNSNELLTPNAGFIAFTVFGQAPLKVQFKDISTGAPNLWNWNFGDGGTGAQQHPLHIYEQPGIYTVKLTISDGSGTSLKTRTDYITVLPAGNCDTISYPFTGDYTFYTIIGQNSGYVSGNNSYGDLAKASYFYDYEAGSQLVAGIFDFAIAKRLTTNDPGIKFKVWDNDGSFNAPGTVLDSVEVNISEIVEHVDFSQSTVIVFDPPVIVNGPFFLGVELPQIVGDTLALFTNENGVVPVGNGWEQQNTGDWFPYSDEQNSWALDIDHTIFPVMCSSLGIENPLISENMLVYPNPASSTINITFLKHHEKDMEIRLTDLTGRIVACGNISGNQAEIEVSRLSPGTYFLSLISSTNVITRKIVVGR
jgi:PKD repeat protein